MLGNISVSTDTYMTWQTILAVLMVVSMLMTAYRTIKGPSKDEMTYFREEVMRKLDELKREDEETTERLEAHIDRTDGEKRHHTNGYL